MAELLTLFLCPQAVNDFKHEMGVCYDQRPRRTVRSRVLPTYTVPYSIFTLLLSSMLFTTLLRSSSDFHSIYDAFFILVYIDSIYTASLMYVRHLLQSHTSIIAYHRVPEPRP